MALNILVNYKLEISISELQFSEGGVLALPLWNTGVYLIFGIVMVPPW